MSSLRLLFSSFYRIMRVLPTSLRRPTFVLFGGMLLLGFFELGGILSLSFFAGVLNSPESIVHSRYIKHLLQVFPSLVPFFSDTHLLMLYSVVPVITLIFLKNSMAAWVSWKTGLLSGEVAGYIGCEIMQRFVHMPYDWHISASSADAFTRMSWRFALGQLLMQSLVAYSSFITAGLLFLGLFIYVPEMTLLVLSIMSVTSMILYNVIRRHIDTASSNLAQAQGEESRATMSAVRGIREILIYQQQPAFLQAIAHSVRKGIRPQAFLSVAPPIPSWVLESAGFLLVGLTLAWLLLVRNADRAVVTTSIAMLTLTAWRVLPSLNRAVGGIVNIRANLPMGMPCLEYMESMKATPLSLPTAVSDFAIQTSIELDNIHYRYPGAKEDSLCGITLSIPAGKRVGFVGKSGAGKSTLVNILSGLLQPSEGRLLVDGRDVSGDMLIAYRRKVGYVPQTPYLMPGTIQENIAFSQWGAPVDMQKLHTACNQAGIDFLGTHFEGCTRTIGENGAGLSGGQAQRVTIARALYAQPTIIIFDEATSSLDQPTADTIQQTINSLPNTITSFIVSHNEKAFASCDVVYIIEGGRIVSTKTKL